MRLHGIGLDLVEVRRIGDLLDRRGERFTRKIFTEVEAGYCRACPTPAPRFAARFAAKEAIAKALGTGIGRHLGWRDMEIFHQAGGRPAVRFSGAGQAYVRSREITEVLITLTHTGGVAVAQAVAVGV